MTSPEICSHQTVRGRRCRNRTRVGNACLIHFRQVTREIANDPNNTWQRELRGEWRERKGYMP